MNRSVIRQSMGILLLATALLPACGNTPATGIVSPDDAPPAGSLSDAQEGTPRPGSVSRSTPNPSSPNDSQPATKGLLLVSGGLSVTGTGLYILNTTARAAIPIRFSGYSFQYEQPQPLAQAGRVVAIARERLFATGESLHLINLRTGQSYPLYNTKGSILSLSPSADGQWIAFAERDASGINSQIRLLNIKTEQVSVLFKETSQRSYSDSAPRFSPDGSTLTFERNGKALSTIMSVPFSAGSIGVPSELVRSPADARISNFQFSPDGKAYVYLRLSSGRSKLVLGIPSQAETVLDSLDGSAYEPAWSPDSESLLFWTDSQDAQELRIYGTRTKTLTSITTITVARGHTDVPVCPTWSTDMKEIYYTDRTANWEGIFKVSLASGLTSRLSDPVLPTPFFCPRLMEYFEEAL